MCLPLSVEVDRVSLYQPPRRVSETDLLLEADPSKSLEREVSTACQGSDEVGTETKKEVAEAMPSNKSPQTTRSNGVKVDYATSCIRLSISVSFRNITKLNSRVI